VDICAYSRYFLRDIVQFDIILVISTELICGVRQSTSSRLENFCPCS